MTEKRKESQKQWKEKNKEKWKKYLKEYYKNNKDSFKKRYEEKSELIKEYSKQYMSTKKGRAVNITSTNNRTDRNRGFDISNNVTNDWVVENIFNGQKCIYCGETDWKKLGVDRVDNKKPHTPDNVVCCCGECNVKRGDRYTIEEFIEYRKTHPKNTD